MTRKAAIAERNKFFRVLKQINKGQSVVLRLGHRFEATAREFDAEGLIHLMEVSGVAGIVLRATRNF